MEDFNSSKNQNIKGQFVDKHIYACMTTMVEYVLAKSYDDTEAPFSNEEIDNLVYFEDANGNEYSQDEKDEQLEKWQDELDAVKLLLESDSENEEYLKSEESLEEQIYNLETADEQYNEIYEWWVCSHWVSTKLAAYGQTILHDGNNSYWGRCNTGQAILLDLVISRICADIEILEGQKNAWE